MNVIKTTQSDISAVAQSHILAFPSSVSSKMGRRFCEKMTEWFIVNERGCIFHIIDNDNNVAGYVSLIKTNRKGQPGSFTCITQYAKKTIVFALIRKPWLMASPIFKEKRKAIIRNIKYILFRKSPNVVVYNNKDIFEPSIGIVGIGVVPCYQGKGYGSKLIQVAKEYAKKEGYKELSLSVNKHNNQAIKAYHRNGFLDMSTGEEIIMKAQLI